MIEGKSVLAVIPARGGSKGLPGKNLREINGKPLIGWPIGAAKGSQYVDRIIISTESQEIANQALEMGADVPFLRPDDLASDEATTISVIEHVINLLSRMGENYDYLLLLEPTSPLTESADIDNALTTLENNRLIADSIVGVSKVEAAHPFFDVKIGENGLLEPYIRQSFSAPVRRQDLPDVYFFEGSLYISDMNILLEKRTFYHERTLPFVVPRWKAFEIDELLDLICVEAIMKNISQLEKKEV